MNFLRQCVIWGIGFPALLIVALCLLVFSTNRSATGNPLLDRHRL